MPRLKKKHLERIQRAKDLSVRNRRRRSSPIVLATDSEDEGSESAFSGWEPTPPPLSQPSSPSNYRLPSPLPAPLDLYLPQDDPDYYFSSENEAESDPGDALSIISLSDSEDPPLPSKLWKEIGMASKTKEEMKQAVKSAFGSRAEGYNKKRVVPRQTKFSRDDTAVKRFK